MSGRIGPYLNNTNLVLCLDFVNTKCYSTGLTASDLSKKSITATMSSSITYGDKGMIFTGVTGSYITVPPSNITNSFTLNVWMKPTGLSLAGSTAYLGILNSINGNSGQINRLLLTSTYDRFLFQCTDGVTQYNPFSDFFTSIQNKISMVTVTYYNSTIRFYLNGNPISTPATISSSIAGGTSKSTIGWGANSNDYYFNGIIYGISIYDSGLNSDDVYSLFRGFRSKYGV